MLCCRGTDVSIENMHQGFTHVFESTFDSAEGIAEYISHPAHVEFANTFLAKADKVIVIDYKPTAVHLWVEWMWHLFAFQFSSYMEVCCVLWTRFLPKLLNTLQLAGVMWTGYVVRSHASEFNNQLREIITTLQIRESSSQLFGSYAVLFNCPLYLVVVVVTFCFSQNWTPVVSINFVAVLCFYKSHDDDQEASCNFKILHVFSNYDAASPSYNFSLTKHTGTAIMFLVLKQTNKKEFFLIKKNST